MEVKTRLVLKHMESGRYLSWSADNFPLTHKLSQARRFCSLEELAAFLEVSPYRPEDASEFTVEEIEIEYRSKGEDEHGTTTQVS